MGKQRHVAEGERVPPKEGRQSSFYAFTLKTDSKLSFRKGQFPCKHQHDASLSAGRYMGCDIADKGLVSPSEDLGHTGQQWRPYGEQKAKAHKTNAMAV